MVFFLFAHLFLVRHSRSCSLSYVCHCLFVRCDGGLHDAVRCCLLFYLEASFCQLSDLVVCSCVYTGLCGCANGCGCKYAGIYDAKYCLPQFFMQMGTMCTACKVLDDTDVSENHSSTLSDVLVHAWERKSGSACVCKGAQVLPSSNLQACIWHWMFLLYI